MSKPLTILIVDDEKTIREVVRRYLELESYVVLEATTGKQAMQLVETKSIDLIVLDIMLPELDGFAIIRKIRHPNDFTPMSTSHDVPIIFLTARKEEIDRLNGFEYGGDDYMVKPFSPRELIARIKAVLRRSNPNANISEEPITLGSLSINPKSRSVNLNEQSITLTAKEFDLLWFFMRHPRQVFSRTQLLDNVWGYEFYGDESTVTVHVRRLREKIEPDPNKPIYIQTIWGIGYKLEVID